jgi:hypothetical protein
VTPLVAGVFVASAVVTFQHWRKVRDGRLLLLMGVFLMMASAESLVWWHPWRYLFELAAAGFGLAMLPMLRGSGGSDQEPAAPSR